MKKCRLLRTTSSEGRWFFAFIMIFLILIKSVWAGSLEMVICYEDKEQPPYYMKNSNEVPQKKPGIAVEIVQALPGEIEGLHIQLKRLPWTRCKAGLKSNAIDGIFNASYSRARLEIGCYPTRNGTLEGPVDTSKRITTINYSLYTLKNGPVQWDGRQITGGNGIVGAPLGYSVVNDLKQQGYTVETAPDTRSNLNKLLGKRIFVLALQDITADSIIRSDVSKFGAIIKQVPPYVTKPYYLMISHGFVKAHPKISQQIWEAVKKIRNRYFEVLAQKYSE